MSRTSKSDPGNSPEPFGIATPEPRRPSTRVILFAGVAGACALGVGAGLWARPAMHERQATQVARAETPPPAPKAAHQLEIVVDDHPRAVGTPLDVLPPGMAAPTATPAPAPAVTPPPPPQPQLAPRRPPEGLIRAQAPIAPPAAQPHEGPSFRAMLPAITAAVAGAKLALAKLERPAPSEVALATPPPPVAKPAHRAELARAQAHELAIARADAAKAEAHRAALAKAEIAAQATAEAEDRKAELARAEAAKAESHRLALAKAQAAKLEAHRQDLARADQAKAQAAHKLQLAKEAKAEKAEKLRLARAEARAKAAQREEARLEALAEAAEAKKRTQLARLAHALAQRLTGHERAQPAEQARFERKHGRDGQVQQASLKGRRRHEPPRIAVASHQKARPKPLPPPPASGLMRVSTTPRCASRDPGAALVCADPGLSAAERQMNRAYQGARSAGVPDAQLQMGQQRWLAARSAAAREAPWAVRDIYMARIAELNGQAKEAQGGY